MFVCRHKGSRIVLIRHDKLTPVCIAIVMISFPIEFGIKTDNPNTTKSKFVRYLCFIAVDFIHSCHYRFKMSTFCLEKQISVNRSDLLAIKLCNHWVKFLTALNANSWKDFWSKSDSSNFETSPINVFLTNENSFSNRSPCLLAEMAKVASLVARPRKCYITLLGSLSRKARKLFEPGLSDCRLLESRVTQTQD